MKTLFLFILFLIAWFFSSISYEIPYANANTMRGESDAAYLFEENIEGGHWEYMNETISGHSMEDKLCLQQNIFFEAATENKKGRVAVAMVTLNRVKSKKFPNTICNVVRQAKTDDYGFPLKNQCQFSWYCDGLLDEPDLTNKYIRRVWNEVGDLVDEILDGNHDNPIGKSVFYHSKKVNPDWSGDLYVHSVIGEHIFYVRGL